MANSKEAKLALTIICLIAVVGGYSFYQGCMLGENGYGKWTRNPLLCTTQTPTQPEKPNLPAEGRFINKRIQVESFEVFFSVPYTTYTDYAERARSNRYTDYITPNDPNVAGIAQTLEQNSPDFVAAVVAFTQGIPYDPDAATGFDEYRKYPIETLVEQSGDCEDKSFLAASLLKAGGVTSALIIFPDHMGVGIQQEECTGDKVETETGNTYCYLEVSDVGWKLGELPNQYQGQVKVVEI